MRRAMLLMSSVFAFTGCVSEQVTYEPNLQPNQYLATRCGCYLRRIAIRLRV